MNPKAFARLLPLACLGLFAAAGARAETAAAPAEAATPAPAAKPSPNAQVTEPGEPNVKWTIIEDEGSRIDELKVRGQTQRITVTPKGGGALLKNRPYEILTPGSSQDLQEAPNGVKGAGGKRVWHVLSF